MKLPGQQSTDRVVQTQQTLEVFGWNFFEICLRCPLIFRKEIPFCERKPSFDIGFHVAAAGMSVPERKFRGRVAQVPLKEIHEDAVVPRVFPAEVPLKRRTSGGTHDFSIPPYAPR